MKPLYAGRGPCLHAVFLAQPDPRFVSCVVCGAIKYVGAVPARPAKVKPRRTTRSRAEHALLRLVGAHV